MSFFSRISSLKTLNYQKISNNITLDDKDYLIGCDTNGGAISITLPLLDNIKDGKVYIIKDEGGYGGTNNITIYTQGAQNIDNETYYNITSNYGLVAIYGNKSTKWHVMYIYPFPVPK